MSLDANADDGLSVAFSHGNSDPGTTSIGFHAEEGKMRRFDLDAVMDDSVEIPMGLDRVSFFHGARPQRIKQRGACGLWRDDGRGRYGRRGWPSWRGSRRGGRA